MKVTAVIVAGGKGTRMGAKKNKVFLPILGREVLFYTLNAFDNNKNISEIVVVTAETDIIECRQLIRRNGFSKVKCVVKGGAERQASVKNGLDVSDGDIVLIQDGARALVTDNEIDAAISDCIKYGAAAAGVACKDTLKHAENGFISGTIDRENTYLIQTPQAFYLSEIREMHERAESEGFCATDDCMIAERYGKSIKISAGSYDNIKLTTPEDLIIGEEILKKRGYKNADRTGI